MNQQFSPEKLKANLTQMVKRVLETQNRVVTESMFELQADYINRIFKDGEDSDGNAIGTYSTKPMYYSIAGSSSQMRSSSLRPRGKNSNKAKFNNGNPRKSQYFPDGYNGFRAAVGRQNTKVDLALTFSLRGSIQVGETQNTVTLGFNSDKELKKAAGNETRYNKTIFSVSEAEVNTVVEKWRNEVENAFFDSFE